ncbi:MAG: hypothetical protein AABX77_02465 [Nanoarchaeota archaeon]
MPRFNLELIPESYLSVFQLKERANNLADFLEVKVGSLKSLNFKARSEFFLRELRVPCS